MTYKRIIDGWMRKPPKELSNITPYRKWLVNYGKQFVENGDLLSTPHVLELGAGFDPLTFALHNATGYFLLDTERIIFEDPRYTNRSLDIETQLPEGVELIVRANGIPADLQLLKRFEQRKPTTLILENILSYISKRAAMSLIRNAQQLIIGECVLPALFNGLGHISAFKGPEEIYRFVTSEGFNNLGTSADQLYLLGFYSKEV